MRSPDIMGIKESIEEMGDQMRWVPTDHMLVDCMTKSMPPDLMLTYLKTMQYSFKYVDVIKKHQTGSCEAAQRT